MKCKPLFKKFIDFTDKHMSTMLIMTGVITSGAAVVLAIKATPRVLEDIENEKAAQELTEDEKLPVKDTVIIYAKGYGIPAVTWTLGMACFIVSHKITVSDIAGMTALANHFRNLYQDHKDATEEVVGEEKANEINSAASQKTVERTINSAPIIVRHSDDGTDMLCYDTLSNSYFYSNKVKIKEAVTEYNTILNNDIYSDVGTLFDLYHLDTDYYALRKEFGYHVDFFSNNRGNLEVSFGIEWSKKDKNVPVCIVYYNQMPRSDYATFY